MALKDCVTAPGSSIVSDMEGTAKVPARQMLQILMVQEGNLRATKTPLALASSNMRALSCNCKYRLWGTVTRRRRCAAGTEWALKQDGAYP